MSAPVLAAVILFLLRSPSTLQATHDMPCPDLDGDGVVTVDNTPGVLDLPYDNDVEIEASYFGQSIPPAPPQVEMGGFPGVEASDITFVASRVGQATKCQDAPVGPKGSPPLPTRTPKPTWTPTPTPTWTPTPTPTWTPTPTEREPVILIPGFLGTRLHATRQFTSFPSDGERKYANDVVVWGNLNVQQNWYYALALKPDANGRPTSKYFVAPPDNSLDLTPLIQPQLGEDPYPFHKPFTGAGYRVGRDLFIFGWDWRFGAGRKDLDGRTLTYVRELDAFIDQVRTQTGHQKVNLVAHSQGGYVAWLYISGLNNDPNRTRAAKVNKLITLATPYMGAPEAAAAMLFGLKLGVSLGPLGTYGLNADTTFRLSGTMPGLAEFVPLEVQRLLPPLLPPRSHFSTHYYRKTYYKRSWFRRDQFVERRDLDYREVWEYIKDYRQNAWVMTAAQGSRQDLKSALELGRGGVTVYVIAGTGLVTLDGIFEKLEPVDAAQTRWRTFGAYSIGTTGDETVPAWSSLGGYQKFSQNGVLARFAGIPEANVYQVKQNHRKLVGVGPATTIVVDILQGRDPGGGLTEGVDFKRGGAQPFPVSNGVISIRSPLNLLVTDSSGNQTGVLPDGSSQEGIPDSVLLSLGPAEEVDVHHQTIFVSAGNTYDIALTSFATEQDTFDLGLTLADNGIESEAYVYLAVPVGPNTKAKLQWPSTGPPSLLEIDQDGDGVFEEQRTPDVAGSTDSDGDGLLDGVEVFDHLTDPQVADTDGDLLSDGTEVRDLNTSPLNVDTDRDGCAESEELGSNQNLGGGRDYLNFWDFFDTPNPNASPQRDKVIDIGDIVRVVDRFGTTGDPTIDPLSTPAKTGYHTAYDRTTEGPPDGAVDIFEITAAVAQFGHTCVVAP